MVSFIESTILQSLLVTLAGALLLGLVFYLLNRRDSKVDDGFYRKSFDPKSKLSANAVPDKDFVPEPDPVTALKAYAAPPAKPAKDDRAK